MNADNMLTNTLTKLFALTESYPDLKANENFLELQRQLEETENKISYARKFYNDTALQMNNKVDMFPSNIIAGLFNSYHVDIDIYVNSLDIVIDCTRRDEPWSDRDD